MRPVCINNTLLFDSFIPFPGLQCMYEVYGGTVTYAGEIMHGKTSAMYHG